MSKILVDIIQHSGIRKRKKCRVEGDTVIIEKASRGRGNAGWKPTYSGACITYKKRFLRGLAPMLEVKEDATHCLPVMQQNPDDVPSCTRKAVGKFFEANVIKAAGATATKLDVPLVLWMVMFVQVAISFIMLMRLWGKL